MEHMLTETVLVYLQLYLWNTFFFILYENVLYINDKIHLNTAFLKRPLFLGISRLVGVHIWHVTFDPYVSCTQASVYQELTHC